MKYWKKLMQRYVRLWDRVVLTLKLVFIGYTGDLLHLGGSRSCDPL